MRESSRAQFLAVQSWSQATEARLERQQRSGALPVFQLLTYNLAGPCTCEGTCCAPVVRRHLSLPHHAPTNYSTLAAASTSVSERTKV